MYELAVSVPDPSRNTQHISESTSSSSKVHDELWVDRYRPQQYTDLLGDDRVHREVMAWVKEWDYCVFGKAKGKQKMTEDGQYFDEYRRPREKVNRLYSLCISLFLSHLRLLLAVVNFWATRFGKDNVGACDCETGRVQGFRDQCEVCDWAQEINARSLCFRDALVMPVRAQW